jgi:hypothetical protein
MAALRHTDDNTPRYVDDDIKVNTAKKTALNIQHKLVNSERLYPARTNRFQLLQEFTSSHATG